MPDAVQAWPNRLTTGLIHPAQYTAKVACSLSERQNGRKQSLCAYGDLAVK
ncbi:hypothetical protein ASZ90_010390 [hydrocarbon metagenome]|uniref:Uncharacterized protein n=1 Tax=hydrocarbon metagenome TaxID=938273 RepID=A0A0W8FG70_9ZZZZ